ncbi:hypothetical protein K2173_004007 [Erythroxylum novogranatense]|uniref:Uncharacterized protein n=1 Tax=Erythroxylum novogranatense TaxID=1862640 RepID=A0AAV8SK61_9ROSI|nr:hypothetical protein K2173_004007 [Erythroxylum novogranatense]
MSAHRWPIRSRALLSRGRLQDEPFLRFARATVRASRVEPQGLGFLIQFGFKRKHGSWWFGAPENHPFVKVKAHPILGSVNRAKDLIFGHKMGAGSQASGDVFRWFCVESGNARYPTVVLIDGFPSQLCYRRFGFSDKPQPRYGFDYTLNEYVSTLKSLIDEMAVDKASIVVQGYFSPVVVKYAYNHQEKLKDLVLLNPPNPLRANDKGLTSCGPYKMKEDDAAKQKQRKQMLIESSEQIQSNIANGGIESNANRIRIENKVSKQINVNQTLSDIRD